MKEWQFRTLLVIGFFAAWWFIAGVLGLSEFRP